MKNDSALRNRYLEQYIDIYGENVYLSSLDSVKNKISTIKGGSELTALYHLMNDCENCSLGDSTIVFGEGNENARIVFIAESKCKMSIDVEYSLIDEAGELFDKILSAINLSRVDVYISNILKYTLSKNSDLNEPEIKICESHFQQQLQYINPQLIVALGEDVGNKMLNLDESIQSLIGKIHNYNNINLMVTYHPEAILKNPKLKQTTWEDFKKIRDNYLN